MKRFLIIFILLVPFISYADGNGNGDCINYNDEIQNLIKSNDYYSTYEYLRYSYLDYYKKCGNTDDLKLLVDKYISLIDTDFNYTDYDANLKLIRALRPYLNEVQYNSLKKSVIVNNIKSDKELLLNRFLLDVYYIDVSDDNIYEFNNLLQDKVDVKLIEYYSVDTNKSCEGDGESHGNCTYKYIYNKPLKVSGTLTVSNLYNQENTDYPNYFKASFKADNLDVDFSKLFVVPINYHLNIQIPKNYLQKGAVGEITFNVDFILDKDSIIKFGKSSVGNIFSIYVKDLNINSVKNIKYYDEAFINSYKFNGIIKSFKINSKDSFLSLRDMPNGKVIYKTKLDSNSNSFVYFYRGYNEQNPDYYFDAAGVVPSNYLYNYYKILKFLKPIVNDWYFVTYFPNYNSKPVFGYIHSSQLSYDSYGSYDEYSFSNDGSKSFNLDTHYLNSLRNIDSLSYIDIFNIFYKMYDKEYNFSRVPYIKNQYLQSLVDKYVSYLLSSNFIMRNNEDGMSSDIFFINSFLYYISDNDYYKILDKYSKDIVKYDKLFKKNRSLTCSNAVKNIISPKYASYFKFDSKRCDYFENNKLDKFNKLFYGIYDADKFFKQMILRYNLYNFNAPNQVKVNGKVIIDSLNHDISFMFNDLLLMDNVTIYPLNYSFDKSVNSNIINKGYLGKVSFDVELTLSKNTLLLQSEDNKLFVDNMHIKNAKNITYYDIDYYEPIEYLDFIISHYEVYLIKGSAPLLDFPNGKVITNIKNGGKVYLVRFNIDSLWDNILDYKYNNVLGKYYRVIYFPDGVIEGSKAISGYINSDLIKQVFN